MERLGCADGEFDAERLLDLFRAGHRGSGSRIVAHGTPRGLARRHDLGAARVRAGTSAWWSAVKEVRPDLVSVTSPWNRITEPAALRAVLQEAGIANAEITAEESRQPLRSPEDWWTIALGSGFRWTIEQLGSEAAARVRDVNLARLRRDKIEAVETNALFARARKPG
jgi:hypothetical protein